MHLVWLGENGSCSDVGKTLAWRVDALITDKQLVQSSYSIPVINANQSLQMIQKLCLLLWPSFT